MTVSRAQATRDELLAAVDLLTSQIKVLIAAVDDLRCEIEWQGRNATDASPLDCHCQRGGQVVKRTSEQVHVPNQNSVLSAAGRLRAFEEHLSMGMPQPWQDDWTDGDYCELPIGGIVSVDPDLWGSILDFRPAHVVGEGCCCEEGEGAPYLLAWRKESECLLRELTDEESRSLQSLCLNSRADVMPRQVPEATPVATQLDLF